MNVAKTSHFKLTYKGGYCTRFLTADRGKSSTWFPWWGTYKAGTFVEPAKRGEGTRHRAEQRLAMEQTQMRA